jgi:hypothetical protein
MKSFFLFTPGATKQTLYKHWPAAVVSLVEQLANNPISDGLNLAAAGTAKNGKQFHNYRSLE